jgi:hypothetical protein
MAIGIPGINLPTQSMAGPVATGQSYAQQIAGGMPMEQIIAPGVSYSPEQPMGYTQEDLTPKFVGEGPVLVMPKAPTKGTPFAPNEGFVQMPSAPQGVTGPTRLLPSLQGLDFSGLPRYEDIRDIRGVEDITPTLFDIDVEEILKDIDTEKFEDIDLTGIDIPSIAPVMPSAPEIQQPIIPVVQEPIAPVMPQVPVMPEPVIPQVPVMREVPVMPRVPIIPEPVIQQPPVRQEVPFVPEIPSIPMNFTGLPQMPVMPNIPVMPELPVVPQPIVPQPIQPMNFTRLSNLPVSNFVQPSVEDIVSPISRGRTLPQTPRGLFSL